MDYCLHTYLGSMLGRNIVEDAILESLYFLPYIIRSTTNLGLLNGTVYDVPLTRAATGTFNVSATGFDVSCGYLTATNVTSLDDHTWLMSVQGSTEVYEVAFSEVVHIYGVRPK
jgi:hypothetical protein